MKFWFIHIYIHSHPFFSKNDDLQTSKPANLNGRNCPWGRDSAAAR